MSNVLIYIYIMSGFPVNFTPHYFPLVPFPLLFVLCNLSLVVKMIKHQFPYCLVFLCVHRCLLFSSRNCLMGFCFYTKLPSWFLMFPFLESALLHSYLDIFMVLQILPEKYSYYRRFGQNTNHATDCVICMTAIDLSQRSNDCMVCKCSLDPLLL